MISGKTSQGTLILSPHPDDAAFSLGGSIAVGRLPQPIWLLTVFGRSSWTIQDRQRGEVDRVTAIRRAEEESYAARRHLSLIWLGFDDALLRGGMKTTFLGRGEDLSDLTNAAEIAAAAGELSVQLMLAPLGIGEHRDHAIVREVAASAAGGAAVAYYEDLPYAGKWRAADGASYAARLPGPLQPVELPIGDAGLQAKLEDLRIYASQMSGWQLRAVRRHGRRRCEKVWADAKAFALLVGSGASGRTGTPSSSPGVGVHRNLSEGSGGSHE